MVPIGGNARILTLRDTILDCMKSKLGREYTFTQTVNMDECMVLGATIFTYLLSQNRIVFEGRASEYLLPFSKAYIPGNYSGDKCILKVGIDNSVTIPSGDIYQVTGSCASLVNMIINRFEVCE